MTASLPSHFHLRALFGALIGVVILLGVGALEGAHLVQRSVHALAPLSFHLKNQGIAFQAKTFEQPDILPLYGSSELVKPIPDKASLFFRRYPTDFSVSPVGKAGTTSLIILQKLAALGPELRGKKVAISLSPSWFLQPVVPPHYYAGNFSRLQAGELVFSAALSWELKRDLARRMLQFPTTMESNPLLAFTLARLATNRWSDRLLYAVVLPFGRLENLILRAQDEFETALYILRQGRIRVLPNRNPQVLDWKELELHATEKVLAHAQEKEIGEPEWKLPGSKGDTAFLTNLAVAREWGDLELLLRGLRELGAEPLLLSMPLDGVWLDRLGVSMQARDTYLARLRPLAARYGAPLLDFHEHTLDPGFLVDHHDHLSVEGWMYYNAALDDFFHGRLSGL